MKNEGDLGIVEGGCVYRAEGVTGNVHRPHALQLVVPVDGALAARVGEVEIVLPRGSAMVIEPDAPRLFWQGVLRISVLLDPEALDGVGRVLGRMATFTVLSGKVGARLHAFAREVCDVTGIDADAAYAAVAEVRSVLRRSGGLQTKELDGRVRAAVALYRCPSPRLGHAAVARRSGISPGHLSRLFKEQVGICAKQYALWVRTVAAMERVWEGALVAEAAETAEFADASHFSRACHRYFGHSPSLLPLRRWRAERCKTGRSSWSVALAGNYDMGTGSPGLQAASGGPARASTKSKSSSDS